MKKTDIIKKAQRLIKKEKFYAFLKNNDFTLQALKIKEPAGEFHSWFVPVIIQNKIIGFFQFLKDGTYLRFSTFGKIPEKLDSCPQAKDWIDPEFIKLYAESHIDKIKKIEDIFLTFDKLPDRIVWGIRFIDKEDEKDLIYYSNGIHYKPVDHNNFG